MKFTKKLFAAALVLAAALAFAACGDKPETMSAPALTGSDLAAYSDGEMAFSYPAEEWAAAEGSYPPTLYYKETYGTDRAVNVNLQRLDQRASALSQDFVDSYVAGTCTPELGITAQVSQLRSLDGQKAMYLETTVKLTDTMLDTLIQAGLMTEESLADQGGREAYLALPETHQITMAVVREGYLWLSTGSYHQEDQKEALVQAMTTLLTTCSPAG